MSIMKLLYVSISPDMEIHGFWKAEYYTLAADGTKDLSGVMSYRADGGTKAHARMRFEELFDAEQFAGWQYLD